jgi:hypothetical protein
MNIGQFVAAEIIILLVINSVEKIVVGLETLNSLIYLCVKLGAFIDTFLHVLDVVVMNLKDIEISS